MQCRLGNRANPQPGSEDHEEKAWDMRKPRDQCGAELGQVGQSDSDSFLSGVCDLSQLWVLSPQDMWNFIRINFKLFWREKEHILQMG